MRNRHVYILAAALALAGVAVFLHKWLIVGLPVQEQQRAAAWEVEAQYRTMRDAIRAGSPALQVARYEIEEFLY